MGQSIHALSFELGVLSGLLRRYGGLEVRLADEMSASDGQATVTLLSSESAWVLSADEVDGEVET
jgi:hypothetical protein